ncbi:MAG: acetyl-CoA carboxylase carboxyltransferase subunit alpha [Verrucomicrobia bacterium]|nr:acetyl-CoA carboxylase carboxyltransferase subunit alpha [Verrucomicrobiota bacterium]
METLPHEKQIREYEETIQRLREQGSERGPCLLSPQEVVKLESKLEVLKHEVYGNLSPVERLAISRHPSRPRALYYIEKICTNFVELHGDRLFGDDPAIVGGFAQIGGQKFIVIGQEKGHDTQTRLHRNFGSAHPEGFRKALRLMQMAEKFSLPVVTLIDTQGAFPGLSAEERGQSWAIAMNLREMARLRTPIISVVLGEAGSGGALALAVADRVGMLEHGYYSVISPEGCASILWKDASQKAKAVEQLKLNSEYMMEFEVIEEVIAEPLGGAHHNPAIAALNVQEFIVSSWSRLKSLSIDELLNARYQKFRKLGACSE